MITNQLNWFMKKLLCVFLFTFATILLSAIGSYAQQKSAATNIRFRLDNALRMVVIEYDLPTVQNGDSLYVELQTTSGSTIRPLTVSGDVGKNLRPGTNKTIYWNVLKDNIQLNEDVQVIIRLARPLSQVTQQRTSPMTSGRPAVNSSSRTDFIPIAGWVATVGLATYSFLLASANNKAVRKYNAEPQVVDTQAELDRFNEMKQQVDSRKGTFYLVAGATAAFAVANVVYMVVKKQKQTTLSINIQPGTRVPTLGLAKKF